MSNPKFTMFHNTEIRSRMEMCLWTDNGADVVKVEMKSLNPMDTKSTKVAHIQISQDLLGSPVPMCEAFLSTEVARKNNVTQVVLAFDISDDNSGRDINEIPDFMDKVVANVDSTFSEAVVVTEMGSTENSRSMYPWLTWPEDIRTSNIRFSGLTSDIANGFRIVDDQVRFVSVYDRQGDQIFTGEYFLDGSVCHLTVGNVNPRQVGLRALISRLETTGFKTTVYTDPDVYKDLNFRMQLSDHRISVPSTCYFRYVPDIPKQAHTPLNTVEEMMTYLHVKAFEGIITPIAEPYGESHHFMFMDDTYEWVRPFVMPGCGFSSYSSLCLMDLEEKGVDHKHLIDLHVNLSEPNGATPMEFTVTIVVNSEVEITDTHRETVEKTLKLYADHYPLAELYVHWEIRFNHTSDPEAMGLDWTKHKQIEIRFRCPDKDTRYVGFSPSKAIVDGGSIHAPGKYTSTDGTQKSFIHHRERDYGMQGGCLQMDGHSDVLWWDTVDFINAPIMTFELGEDAEHIPAEDLVKGMVFSGIVEMLTDKDTVSIVVKDLIDIDYVHWILSIIPAEDIVFIKGIPHS